MGDLPFPSCFNSFSFQRYKPAVAYFQELAALFRRGVPECEPNTESTGQEEASVFQTLETLMAALHLVRSAFGGTPLRPEICSWDSKAPQNPNLKIGLTREASQNFVAS